MSTDVRGRILVARPCHDTYKYGNIITVEIMRNFSMSNGYIVHNKHARGSNICKLRMQLAQFAVENKYDHILYVDSDTLVMKDSLLRLLEADRDIVSGVYVAKQPNYMPHVYRNGQPVAHLPKDVVVDDIDYVGFGFILIKTSVFEKVEKPWFLMDDVTGEDEHFCTQAKRAGFKISVDTSCQLGHFGDYAFTIDDFEAYNVQSEPLLVNSQGKALVN